MQRGMRRCQLSNCYKMHALLRILSAVSTHAHARRPNGSILNHDHFNKWSHFNKWNDCCMLRWRSHPIPWRLTIQDHVLAGLLLNTNPNWVYLLYMLHLLNLHRDALGLLLILLASLLIAFLLSWRSWLLLRRSRRKRSRIWLLR